jgi:opacity protein-like surface antigen
MKKIILTASLAAIIGAGSITTAHADPFKGAYGGVHMGWGQQKIKIQNTNRAPKSDGMPFGVHVGMSTVAANNIFMAGQLDMDFFIRNNIKVYTPAATAKLGYRFGERVVVALTMGAVYSNYQLKNSLNQKVKKWKFGYRPGMEVQYAVNDKNIFGLSYQFTKSNGINYTDPTFGRLTLNPSGQTVMVSYSYKF